MRRSIYFLLPLALVSGLVLFFNLLFTGKVHPNIYLAGVNIGKLKPEEAALFVSNQIKMPDTIKLTSLDHSFDLNTKDIDLTYDFEASVQRGYNFTRTGNIFLDQVNRIKLLLAPQHMGLILNLNEEKLNKYLSVVSGQISIEPIYPSAKIVGVNVQIDKGQKGSEIDINLLRSRIGETLAYAKNDQIELPIKDVDPTLSDEEALVFKTRAEKFIGKKIAITFEFEAFNLGDSEILTMLNPKGGLKEEMLNDQIYKIASNINREPQDSKFNFEGGKVIEFLPAKDGVELDVQSFKEKLTEELDNLENSTEKSLSFEAPVSTKAPKITTEKVNDLGIKELIGRGTSKFRGSIPSRVHNVALASSRLNGVLIKPGETFSFNDALGDVSQFTGYQQAYIIRDGKTILGDGGGVCQVSTTLFRAVLNAGLPILERQAHAYRVGYYEQDSPPGLDATVYGPSPDLKIKNDTTGHVLIQASADTKNYSLVFELYGTNDGRVATTSKPITSSVTPPGDDLYIDDPTLPTGVVKQTEHKANGAKVTFNYHVTRDGEEIYQKTFISNYRPWQAVFLRGTAPVQ